jgi:predicted DNA-binding protein with PD1-like motif
MLVSDNKGMVYGGHLLDYNIINTNCELVINELDDYVFNRIYNNITGYQELDIKKTSKC